MRAGRTAAAMTFSCPLRGHGDAERTASCLAKARARASRLLDVAQARAARSGFVCPAGLDALAVSERSNWPLRAMTIGGDWGDPGCRRSRARAARRFSSAYGRCVEKAGVDGIVDPPCVAAATSAFVQAWEAASAACGAIDVDQVLLRLAGEVEETATRLRVRCGDGEVGGFEQCDDGGTVGDDGCSADCRRETCTRVEGEVRCAVCPDDAVPDAAGDGCRCPAGFEGEPGNCRDLDECAAGGVACPDGRPCVNLQDTFACAIPCTAEAFHAALADCGAPSGAIAFDCRDTTIVIPGGGKAARDTPCSGLVIDGAGRNIAFELDPACWRTPLAPEQCPAGLEPDGTCACPDMDSGDQFLLLRGDGNVVRDVTVRGFFDGIPVRGRNNTVEDVRFERQCDDSFGSVLSGVGNVFRRLAVREGCDKCSENGASSLSGTDPDPRVVEHYNAVLRDVDFDGCRTPVRVSSAGRFLLDRVAMRATDADFPCDGPRFTSATNADTVVVRVENSSVEGCRHGLRFGRGTEAVVTDSRVAGGRLRGLRVGSTAKVSVSRTTVDSNGGEGSSESGFGGAVLVGAEGSLDLGGGELLIDGRTVSSEGANSLCDNRAPDSSRRDVDTDPSRPVTAAGNWWCSEDPLADRIFGPVTADPLRTRAPLAFRER